MVRYYPAGEKWHTFRNHSKDIRTIFAFAKETGDFRDQRTTDDFAPEGRYIRCVTHLPAGGVASEVSKVVCEPSIDLMEG